MSQISLKSITGITSITTPTGVDNQFTLHTNNTNQAFKLNSVGNIHINNHLNITGVSTASNFKTGTTDLHSLGLTAATADIDDSISVGSNIHLGNAGIITATTFSGSGASLTNLPSAQLTGALPALDGSNLTGLSGVSVANQADNRLITATGTTDALNGESGLTYTSNILDVDNAVRLPDTGTVHFGVADTAYVRGKDSTDGYVLIGTNGAIAARFDTAKTLRMNECPSLDATAGSINITGGTSGGRIAVQGTTTSANTGIGEQFYFWGTNKVAGLIAKSGTDTSNKDDGQLSFYTSASGPAVTERVQIKPGGGLVSSKGGSNAFSDGYSAIEARAPEGTTQLTVTNTTYESGTFDNEAGIWFKGNYSGNDERAKSAIIHKNTGDFGVGDLYFCIDGNADNSNATVSDVKMKITKDGQVTKPSTYKFLVETNGQSVSGGWNKLTGLSIDSSYSTGVSNGTYWSSSNQRFTAPVSGTYLFFIGGFSSTAEGGGTNHRYMYVFQVNGSGLKYGFGGNYSDNNTPMAGGAMHIPLSANDYVEVQYYTAISATWGAGHRFFWGGYFLG